MLGECKWGIKPVGPAVIRELANKAALVVPGEDWQVYYYFFAQSGFTAAAKKEAKAIDAQLMHNW